MKKYLPLLVASLISVPAMAAQPGLYGGAHYSAISLDSEDGENFDFGNLGGQLGYQFNDFLALEGRAAFSVQDDNISGTSIDVELQNNYGIYLLPQYHFNNVFSVYGLVGWTKAKLKVSGYGQSASDSDSDMGFGGGLKLAVSDQAHLFLEYAKLMEVEGDDIDAVTFGINFSF
ncbi:porin family protein [Gallaecimonas xiamenensis]|uniref:Outer membrane protein beta-barrel domain-containing protein n=1 Tax=Gallaecimonas xiamenensis 3-C-1 TaxID=745411 RepID=K2J5C9_9GAMM|nr:porin family protein [Gallaecimonas xiamenensis]EKE70243.1 hypothetical protein B3C1_14113 [Gallaecimonas xiamenensis 3-C-1]